MIWPEEFAPQAIRDVEKAVDWFDDQGGPDLARRMAKATVVAARRVVAVPLIGHARPDLLGPPFRFWAVPGFPYLLVYDASAAPPKVLRVLHTSRDLPPLLADLRDVPSDQGSR